MDFDDVVYKRRIIDMLNTIVMTTSELHSLRIRLKDMKTEVRYFCLCAADLSFMLECIVVLGPHGTPVPKAIYFYSILAIKGSLR